VIGELTAPLGTDWLTDTSDMEKSAVTHEEWAESALTLTRWIVFTCTPDVPGLEAAKVTGSEPPGTIPELTLRLKVTELADPTLAWTVPLPVLVQ